MRIVRISDVLVDWLNQESPDNYGKNTRASRVHLLELRSAIETVRDFIAPGKRSPQEVRTAQKKIKDAARRYPLVQTVEIRAASGKGKSWNFHKPSTPGIPYGESRAVWRLFELAKTSEFPLLRKCECGRWFLAKRHDQRGCCSAHSRKAYEKTDKFKAYRRDLMRKLYAIHRDGKVKEGRG
jgi:hypothetical protein